MHHRGGRSRQGSRRPLRCRPRWPRRRSLRRTSISGGSTIASGCESSGSSGCGQRYVSPIADVSRIAYRHGSRIAYCRGSRRCCHETGLLIASYLSCGDMMGKLKYDGEYNGGVCGRQRRNRSRGLPTTGIVRTCCWWVLYVCTPRTFFVQSVRGF